MIGAAVGVVLPYLVPVRRWPGFFLGPDGKWMARKLQALAFGAAVRPAEANGRAAAATNGTGMPLSPEDSPLWRLTRSLAAAGVRYCRCKRRVDVRRVLSGAGDLDLLVDRKDAAVFLSLAEKLGFKRVVNCFEPERVHELHLYGLDPEAGALLHLHVSLALLEGEGYGPSTPPPLEELVLRHVLRADVPGLPGDMPVVDPRAELIVLVLQTVQHYSFLRAQTLLPGRREALRVKLEALAAQEEAAGWRDLLEVWLPAVPPALIAECLEALRQPTSWLRRLRPAGCARA